MLDLDNPLCDALVADLARSKTYVDPTLAVFGNMILLRMCPRSATRPTMILSATIARVLADYCKDRAVRKAARLKIVVAVRKVPRADSQIYFDRRNCSWLAPDSPEPQVTPGFSLHQELEMLVESGFAAAALRSATLHQRDGTPPKSNDSVDHAKETGRHCAVDRQPVR